MARLTIKDIARELGISPSTVSRALHDHPEISEKTKRKVVELAQRYNYQPNEVAKSLQTSKSSILGVIVPDIKHAFFASVISGIEEVAYKAGYTIMVCQSHDKVAREIMNIRALLAHRAAGVLISISEETVDASHLAAATTQGIPLVMFDRVVADMNVSKVVVDDFDAAYEATSYLVQKGYRRIAHLAGVPSISIGQLREAGYRKALEDAGLAVDESLIVHGGFHEYNGLDGMAQLLKLPERPDAVFCVNDPVALGAFEALKAMGLSIPDDVALIGFSNNPVTALLELPLTTVDQPGFIMGKMACEEMLREFDAIAAKRTFVPATKTVKTSLVIRRSA